MIADGERATAFTREDHTTTSDRQSCRVNWQLSTVFVKIRASAGW